MNTDKKERRTKRCISRRDSFAFSYLCQSVFIGGAVIFFRPFLSKDCFIGVRSVAQLWLQPKSAPSPLFATVETYPLESVFLACLICG
jgi:hypothetical protein